MNEVASESTLISIERSHRRGSSLSRLLATSSGLRVVTVDTHGRTQTHEVPGDGATLQAVIRAHSSLHRVGPGATVIECRKDLESEVLAALRISPSAQAPDDADEWMDEDEVYEWQSEDGQALGTVGVFEGTWIDPLWVRINDRRATALRSPRRSAFVLHQEEDLVPDIDEEYLSWSFYGESGGPCTFDGGASLGKCGSDVLAFHQWGDYDPRAIVAFHPTPSRLAETLTEWIWSLDWELAFLRAAVGFPGLTEEELKAIWGQQNIEGTVLSTGLPREVDDSIVRRLARRSPQLRAAIHALRHPGSDRGKAVYGWLRLLAGENWAASSWEFVDRAMVGQIDPPGENPRARSMGEILQDRLDRVAAEVHGWAQAIPIDPGVQSALETMRERPTDVDALQCHLDRCRTELKELPQRFDHARAVLGVDATVKGAALWKAYEARAEKEPDREADFLRAYHHLHNPHGPNERELETRIRDLQDQIALEEQREVARRADEEVARSLGWPVEWDHRLRHLGESLGGTMESARAWADLGWSAATVLGEGQLRVPWNARLSVRVKTLEPPAPPDEAVGA